MQVCLSVIPSVAIYLSAGLHFVKTCLLLLLLLDSILMHYLFLYSLSLLIPMIGPTAVNVKNFKFLPDLRLFFL